jgi:LmbE family N-acetylglucosaminyl deacetylase
MLSARPAGHPRILCVFAHPDDETSVGPLLARYAQEGRLVYLACITSGQKGTAHTRIPAGRRLGAVREREMRCACKALGIHEPFLLGFEDQGISRQPAMDQILARLRQIVNQVKPAAIITLGPDGLTGHPDHRAVSNLTTQVFEQRRFLRWKPRKLYYVAWPESLFRGRTLPFTGIPPGVVADAFITTEVDCRAGLAAARRALGCHATQFPPERAQMIHRFSEKNLGGRVFLRLALSDLPCPAARERDIFEGL